MILAASSETQPAAGAYARPAYRWYVLFVMAMLYACHSLDRALPNILVEPVRNEFHLNDGQLGLFTGLAYGVAFSLMVLPAGWVADRVKRRNLLAFAVVLWSLLTALGGLTRNYAQLLLARVGVGAGESAAAPLVLPMLSDIFPANRRALAIGILYMAVPLGALLATSVGGYVAAEHGWRTAFFLAGIPGLVIAVLLMTTVREPARGASDEGAAATEKTPVRLGEGFVHYWRNPGLLMLMLGGVILGLLNIIMGAWMSSFFIRVHGLSLTQTGLILGLGAGLCGIFSPLSYGWLADQLSRRNPLWSLRLGAIGAILSMIFTLMQLFTPVVALSIVGFIAADFLRTGYTPPLYSVLMTKTPARIRSSVMSVVQLITNLVGFGLGPLLTGMLSEHFGGGVGIKYALATVSSLFVVAAALLLISGRLLFGGGGRRQSA